MYELSTLCALVVVHISVDLGNIPMSHRKIIRVSDARGQRSACLVIIHRLLQSDFQLLPSLAGTRNLSIPSNL